MLLTEAIDRLAGFEPVPFPVLSLYLDARPNEVGLRWRDLDGRGREERFEGFAATCVQHEIDHLDGILCTDREEPAPEEGEPAA